MSASYLAIIIPYMHIKSNRIQMAVQKNPVVFFVCLHHIYKLRGSLGEGAPKFWEGCI